MAENFQNDASMTGGAYDFERATTSLTSLSISSSKKVTLVRHGLSSWNEESRVQVCFFSVFQLLLVLFIFFWGRGIDYLVFS